MVDLGVHKKAKYLTGIRLDTSIGRSWDGVLAERWSHSEGDLGEVQVRDTEVIVMIDGRLPVRRRGDGQLQQCNAVPGTIWLCPHGIQEDMIHLYGEVRESIHLFLPAMPLSQTIVREIDTDPASIELKYHGGFRDPLIEQIAWAIRAEMTDPAPAGKMLIETLAMSLGIHIVRHYSNLNPSSNPLQPVRGALDPQRLRRVTDFIDAHLGEHLTIETLAKEACLSPFHFARAFKAATGTAPHRYLSERRLERARALIDEGELPFGTIAYDCGFSSQAHFTRWFKQAVGTTPGGYANLSRGIAASGFQEGGMEGKTVEWETERRDRVLLMRVSGQVNDRTTPKLEKGVRNAVRETDRALILDFGETTLISNRGLQAILLIERFLQDQETRLVLCAVSPRDHEKFRTTGLDRILRICASKAQALALLDE